MNLPSSPPPEPLVDLELGRGILDTVLCGVDSRPEGLAHVFKPTGLSLGRAAYVGKITPDELRKLAALDAEPQPPDPPHEAFTP